MANKHRKNFDKLCHTINSANIDYSAEISFVDKFEAIVLQLQNESLSKPPSDIKSNDLQSYQELLNHQKFIGINLHQQINLFPRLKLVNCYLEQLFIKIENDSYMPPRLKNLIYLLRLPLLLCLFRDPSLLPTHYSLILKLVNELNQFSVIWKDEEDNGFPTYQKINQVLLLDQSFIKNIDINLSEFSQAISDIRNNQQKRAVIFEKRLRETEASKIKQSLASEITDKFLIELLQRYQAADFIQSFIQNIWRKLVILNFLRNDNEAFVSNLETAILLLLTTQEQQSILSMTQLIDYLPKLNQSIFLGFEILLIDDHQQSEFIGQLEQIHISLIEKLSNQVDSVTDEATNSNPHSNTDSHRPTEEILRLKPSELFPQSYQAEVVNEDDTTNHYKTTTSGNLSTNDLVSKHDLISQFESQLTDAQQDKKSNFSIKSTVEYYNELNDNGSFSSLTLQFTFEKGDWFYFIQDQSTYKLLLIEPIKGLFIFMDNNIKIAYRMTSHELVEALKNKTINIIQNNITEDKVLASTNEIMQSYLTQRKNSIEHQKKLKIQKIKEQRQRELQRTVDEKQRQVDELARINTELEKAEREIQIKQQEKIDSQQRLKEELNNQSLPMVKKTNLQVSSEYDISKLPIGSWVTIHSTEALIKCKLAAKIVSKNSYIFVNREGVKLFELNTDELIEYFASKKLLLIDVEASNDQLLASVIEKTRNLKNEH